MLKTRKKMDTLGPVILDIAGCELSQEDKEVLLHPQLGGLIFFTRNFEDFQQLQELVASIRAHAPSLLLCVDHEGGRVQRFREGFTTLPPLQVLSKLAEQNPKEAINASKEIAWLMAAELLAVDIDLSFAPVLDLDSDKSVIIGDRSFCEDPELASLLAESYLDGMHEAGMATTGKHFPGHGGVREDSHTELPIDGRTLVELRTKDILPYKKLLKNIDAVMPAHIVFPDVDSQPVGFSEKWLHEILRDDLGFNGVVFSDDLSMEGAAIAGDYEQRAELALSAGCTSILVCNHRKEGERVLEFLEAKALLPCESNLHTMKTYKPENVDEYWGSKRRQQAIRVVDQLMSLT